MKTKAIVATLLVAAAASADARFAWPYPRKAVSPDESSHWVVINGNAWPNSAESELTTASSSGGGPDRRKIVAKSGKNFPRRGTISRVLRARHPESNSRFVKCRSLNA
jgi:hypothetical protein